MVGAATGLSLVAACGAVSLGQVGSCGLEEEPQRQENVPSKRARTDGYVGKTLAEAESLAASRGDHVRVIGQDGDCPGQNDDFSFNRVNVYLEDGRVRAVEAF
jgi:hypothetical protein